MHDTPFDGSIRALWDDRDGTLWAGGYRGLARLREGKWERVRAHEGFPDFTTVNAIHEDEHGRLLVATESGIFRAESHGRFEPLPPERSVSAFASARGTVWVTDTIRGFAPLSADVPDRSHPVPSVGRGQALATDGTGVVWIGTDHGLVKAAIAASGERPIRLTGRDGLTSDVVLSLLHDPDGTVWVGTERGLDRVVPVHQALRTEFDSTTVSSLVESADGSIWVGTSDGLYRFRADRGESTDFSAGLPSRNVTALYSDAADSVWVATSQGVAHLAGGRVQALKGAAPNRLMQVVALTMDRTGRLWLCDYDGLMTWRPGEPQTMVDGAADHGRPSAVFRDREDRIWVGFATGDVGLAANGTMTWFPSRDGLGRGVNAFHQDSAGVIWVASNGGVSKWLNGGGFMTFGRGHGLPDTSVRAVASDLDGTLWIGGVSGLVGIKPSELDIAAADPRHKVRYRLLDFSDGLKGVVDRRGLPNTMRLANGTLWFRTTAGLTVLTPRQILPEVAPHVQIEGVVADQQAIKRTPSVVVPARTQRLQFTFASINLVAAHKTRYRYQLQGIDTDWIDAGPTRHDAVYANVPPGSYRFVVRATQGGAAESTAAVSVELPPMFYQTKWFALTVLGAVAGAGIALWRRRVNQLHRRYALVLAERTRLAREIHDTLLQGMAAGALHVHAILEMLDSSPVQARAALATARDSLEHYIREARRSILNLRSPALSHATLEEALKQSVHELVAWSHMDARVSVTGSPRRYAQLVEEQILRIGQEAVSNAVQHANATTIDVELEYGKDRVRLKVADDGVGFDASVEKVNHFGLKSMKERAESIGALFHLTSSNSGTIVEVMAQRSAPAES